MDPNVIYVYCEKNQEVLTEEDITEWLGILDKVETAKLQYDTAREQKRYWIRFRHPTAAYQAVQHLNGVKLKNCVVEIRSDVYSSTVKEDLNELVDHETDNTANFSIHLPHNHLVPSDFSMSHSLTPLVPLIECSSQLSDGKTLVEKMKAFQMEWCTTQNQISLVHSEIHKVDVEIQYLLSLQSEV